ncbi:hypothetical protein [Foetidibacter luteolus]|uniref:hypothetical protein n=1 Tax=Foetidibacter luteolus TaxID=2608880 RepID=UPI00129BA501|nr:hypothetical protein [Foetidibacter luteolus]
MVKMISETSEFTFTFERKKVSGTFSEFIVDAKQWPFDKPQLHVHVQIPEEKFGKSFQFYFIEDDTLFWYDLQEERWQNMAKAIADQLLSIRP